LKTKQAKQLFLPEVLEPAFRFVSAQAEKLSADFPASHDRYGVTTIDRSQELTAREGQVSA
jgi:hypothetical protein